MQLRCPTRARLFSLLLCSWILFLAPAPLFPQAASPDSPQSSDHPLFLELDRLTPAQMNPADAATLQKRRRQIAAEAAFFGYDLRLPGWDYDQTLCPPVPASIILHYHRLSRDGAASAFTAVVPRDTGRVFVIPVSYGNATPFHPAPGSARSIDVFNRVVPPSSAAAVSNGEGPWLLLAACYAGMTSAQVSVLEHPGDSIALARAPQPTLHISRITSARWVLFTNRDDSHHYSVWQLYFNGAGRLTAADATRFADYVARSASPPQARIKTVPAPQQPRVKIVPPAKEPQVRTIPQ